VSVEVRPVVEGDRAWIDELIRERWGDEEVVAHGAAYRPASLPGFVAEEDGEHVGLATYRVEADACEIVTIDSLDEGRGIGTALLDAITALGHRRVRLVTTNDNTPALGFYTRRGFEVVEVRTGEVDRSRERKPSIPLVGIGGVEIHDEIELELRVD
jgi:ribosomal protein S18 acetylase RimI-like enzyme